MPAPIWPAPTTRTRTRLADFHQHRVALSAAAADRRDAQTAPARTQGVHEMAYDARTAGAERMAKRDRAAVDVHFFQVQAESIRRRQGHGREGFVDLPERDVRR